MTLKKMRHEKRIKLDIKILIVYFIFIFVKRLISFNKFYKGQASRRPSMTLPKFINFIRNNANQVRDPA